MLFMFDKYKVTSLQASMNKTTFKSQQTTKINKIFRIFVINLMECILCNKKYIGKAEKSFNINLNNSRKDIRKGNMIMTSKHLKQESHNLNKNAKSTITDQLMNTFKCKELLTQKRKCLGSKIKYAIPKTVSKWNSVNNKDNKYNERLLSCISLSKMYFALLQLGHY